MTDYADLIKEAEAMSPGTLSDLEADLLAALKAVMAERDEARDRLHEMHRRTQKVEGEMQRSLTLLEPIIWIVGRSISTVAKRVPEPLDCSHLYHDLCAVRDHARAASGRAQIVAWRYLRGLHDAQNARIAAENAALRARVSELEGALGDIAKQKRTDELDTEYEVECADFEDGYDHCVNAARAALRAKATQ